MAPMFTRPDHAVLPEGEWWACDYPERPPEPFQTHYRLRCEACYPAWRARAAQPDHTFVVDGVLKSLHSGRHTEAEIRAWYIGGIYVDTDVRR